MSTHTNNDTAVVVKKGKKPGLFYRILGGIGRWLMTVVWWPTRIFYKEKFPDDKPVICICNHYAIEDACAIYHRLFGFKGRIVVKSEAMDDSFVGNFLTALCNAISVRRGESDIKAIKEMMKELLAGGKILIFPEGTRNKSKNYKELLPFKDGPVTIAIKTKSVIVPTLYYKPLRPFGFRKNRLIVGDPIDLSAYYGKQIHDVKDEASQLVFDKMVELRIKLDDIMENYGGDLKKYEQAQKERATAEQKKSQSTGEIEEDKFAKTTETDEQ